MNLHGKEIVLATHNKGKIPEMAVLVEPYGCAVSCAGDYGVSEPIEDGDTFEANALLKAHHTAKATGKISMADDSGICVVGLDNAPGIYSARYAGVTKDFNVAMEKVQTELQQKGTDEKGAFFVCCLAVVNPETNEELVFRGEIHGTLTFPKRGDKGFGYDPIFIPNGYDITFGEMEPKLKHSISHRAVAFNKMKEVCFAK